MQSSRGGPDLVSQKEEALSRLNDRELLDLARSVSQNYVVKDTSRKNLIKIVKESLSVEEIKQKVSERKSPLKTKTKRDRAFNIGAVGQAFLVIYGIAAYVMFFVSAYSPIVYTLTAA